MRPLCPPAQHQHHIDLVTNPYLNRSLGEVPGRGTAALVPRQPHHGVLSRQAGHLRDRRPEQRRRGGEHLRRRRQPGLPLQRGRQDLQFHRPGENISNTVDSPL
jgi:hypothetical protein